MTIQASIGPQVLTRWYIDTRPLTLSHQEDSTSHNAVENELPLIYTLRSQDQKTIRAYRQRRDRYMSLASNLLKYLFIHRACKIPWCEVEVSRSAPPYGRPCYVPLKVDGDDDATAVEFNVSHQGCLTALAGCYIPRNATGEALDAHTTPIPQIGIDITCTDDPTTHTENACNDESSYPVGPNNPPKTEQQLQRFLDMMEDVFSVHELQDMRTRGSLEGHMHPPAYGTPVSHRVRLFFTYWALKEAFIKMTGEALFATWLRQLEFKNVDPPAPPHRHRRRSPSSGHGYADSEQQQNWGEPISSPTLRAYLHGELVQDVRLEVVAFEDDYIFTTAARGGGFSAERTCGNEESLVRWDKFRRVDIERDVRPCATGQCRCLE